MTRRFCQSYWAVLCTAAMLSLVLPTLSVAQSTLHVYREVKHDTSLPLADLQAMTPAQPNPFSPRILNILSTGPDQSAQVSAVPDAALQEAVLPNVNATLGFPFVPLLFPASQSQFDFHPAILEVHAGRDERQALLLRFANQLPNLFLMNQKFASTQRSMVGIASVFVGTDMAVQQPQLIVFNEPVGVFEIGFTAPDRLYFGSSEDYARFKFFQQEVVVSRVPVDSGISFSGRGRLPAWILLRTGARLMGRLPGHAAEKKVTRIGHRSQVSGKAARERVAARRDKPRLDTCFT